MERFDRPVSAAVSAECSSIRNTPFLARPATIRAGSIPTPRLAWLRAGAASQAAAASAGQTAGAKHHAPAKKKRPGRIDHIAEQNMEAAPTRMAAAGGGQLATRADAAGVERPLSVVYQANVPIDDASGQIVVGTTGLARIHAGYQPLWQRLWRAACRTFWFEM